MFLNVAYVESMMTRKLETVAPTTNLKEAADIMLAKKNQLPASNRHAKIVWDIDGVRFFSISVASISTAMTASGPLAGKPLLTVYKTKSYV